jgi:hypothetical protein
VANNNYPQITSVTSESLQAQVRSLLPSQEGFGTDLMAQNVIVPVIDLTTAAEGSSVPQYLQTALAFGSQTAFEANNGTATIANNTGFWRVVAVATYESLLATTQNQLTISDGLSSKIIWEAKYVGVGSSNIVLSQEIDLIVFLRAGDTLNAVSSDTQNFITGSARQVADSNGALINPSGFTPQ